jgi:hypothetical protein
LLFLGLVVVGTGASAQTGGIVPTVETIIARMVQARTDNRASFRSYIVTRDYRLFGKDRNNSKSQVIADVTFVPPGFKKYAIQRTQGSRLGEKIVRRMLKGEAEITKEYSSTDISMANYDFRFIGAESLGDQLTYKLELLPRRKDPYLLRGNIWVDAKTYLLRRSEGEPADKSPSWWLRNVRIELAYGDVDGMWLQTASEATVNVRIFGRYTMVTRDLAYKIGDLSVGAAAQTGFSSISLQRSGRTLECCRSVMQDHAEKAAVDCQPVILAVINKAHFSELVHEMTYPRAGCADHLCQSGLADPRQDRFGSAFLAKMGKQQQHPSQTPFAGVE